MITIHSCRLEKLQEKVPIPTKRDCSHLTLEIFLKKVSHRNKVQEKKLIRKAKEVGGKKAKAKICFLHMPEMCKLSDRVLQAQDHVSQKNRFKIQNHCNADNK